MRYLQLFALFVNFGFVCNALQCHWHSMIVDRVIDGDTVALLVPVLPTPLNITGLRLRIRGVDCAETGSRAQCEAESKMGMDAKVFTSNVLSVFIKQQTPLQTLICGWIQLWASEAMKSPWLMQINMGGG
jgi:endonuclease YncB( thermonuclease family)